MPLRDYKELVGTLAGVTTIAQCLSPVFICYAIYKEKRTGEVNSTPFIGGIALTLLMLQHGLLLNDTAMIQVNLFGLLLNAIYYSLFYYYSTDKENEWRKCVMAIGVSVALIGYARMDEPVRAEFYFGSILTILMILLIASPLFSLGEIMRTKSTACLPFPLILSGTVVSFLWLLYGIIIENIFVQVQNVVAFVLSIMQLSLFVIYPSTPVESQNKKTE